MQFKRLCAFLSALMILFASFPFTVNAATAALYGDANQDGAVNNRDVTLINRYLANWEGLTIDLEAADANYDGAVTNHDVTLIMQYLANYAVILGPQLEHDKVFKIKNAAMLTYITVTYGYDENNESVSLRFTDDSALGQTFRMHYNSTQGAYRIGAICSMNGRYRVLDIFRCRDHGYVLDEDAYVQLYAATAADAYTQYMVFTPVGGGKYAIRVASTTNMYLKASGQSVVLASASSTASLSDSMLWYLEPNSNANESYYAGLNWMYPLRGTNPATDISSDYGRRMQEGGDEFHGGMDISATEGTLIYPAHSGTVTLVDYESAGRGYFVVVESNDYVCGSTTVKLRTSYWHMQNQASVSTGQAVTTDTILGKVGNTGFSFGTHLHLGVIINGSNYGNRDPANTVDPMLFYPNISFTPAMTG